MPHRTVSRRTLFASLVAPLVWGCAAAPPVEETSSSQEAAVAGIRTNVASPHAKPGARYLASRPFAILVQIGAVTPLQQAVFNRIRAYGEEDFGVDALLFVEEPTRFATFLPAEQAVFASLWELLEIPASVDLDQEPVFPALAGLVETKTPEAARYDENRRVAIASLPVPVQDAARRVVKSPGAPADTVSFAEVTQALDNYAIYTSAEFFRFDALLRAIERKAATPASFPHLAIKTAPDGTADVAVGAASIHLTRTTSRACDSQWRGASVTTSTTLTVAAPAGVTLTWTPLSAEATLSRKSQAYPQAVSIVPTGEALRVSGGGRGAALVEAFQGTQRVARTLVVLTGDESVAGAGFAIFEGGAFTCIPFEDAAAVTASLSNVVRLPPGRYAVPTPTYGAATLALYGDGVMRLDVGGKSFWRIVNPHGPYPSSRTCWELTSLGPRNDVTGESGAGPGFRFDYPTGKVFFDPQSYGICPYGQAGSGAAVATLTPSSRL